jgi:hypothetical protein
MPILPFSEYRPDVSSYMSAASQVISNVVPRADGYGPAQALVAYTAALPAACRGFFYARDDDGSIMVFAGTSTRLFRLNNTSLTWEPVSNVTAVTSISNASPAVVALTAHGLSINDAVVFSTTGALPTGLTAGTVYYVIAAGFSADQLEVSATLGGAAVNTSSAGSGSHSVTTQYASLPTGNHWQFAQFGLVVIAVQPNVAPQAFTMGTSSAFAALAGSPPQAAYVSVVGRFLVLSGLTSNPYRVHWSGLNAITTWTSGVSSSDFQDLPDGGIVRGVAGGEYGVIFQETAMRRLVYVPGSPVIFNIERLTEDKGLMAPYSLIRAGDKIFFLAAQGFHGMSSAGLPEPIGKERFDRTFLGDYDTGAVQMIIGAADPAATRVYWAYKSQGGSAGLFDKVLVWDYALGRGSIITASGEYLASLAAPGATLESLDSISGSLDALTFSLDDVSTAALSKLSAVDSSHKLGFFSGANLEATLDTSEQGISSADGRADGRRMRVQGFRPVTDAAGCWGAVGARETLQAAVAYSTEQTVNARGLCPANVSTRMARGRLRIPAGTSWTFATGVEPVMAAEGKR